VLGDCFGCDLMANFPWLTTIILFPYRGVLLPVLPDKDGKTVRWYALIVGLIDFALIVYAFIPVRLCQSRFATGRKLPGYPRWI